LSISIEVETHSDEDSIRRLNVLAFDGRTEEADLVDALRTAGDLVLSLVARDEGLVIGHVAFSRVTIEDATGPTTNPVGGVALAPVAVQPGLQGRGIGRKLIEAGLQQLSQRGESVVLVVGNPAYYTRFGFSIEEAEAFPSAYSGPHFMALVWGDPAAIPTGPVIYPDAFELVN
jgi:putative acetyltransferase